MAYLRSAVLEDRHSQPLHKATSIEIFLQNHEVQFTDLIQIHYSMGILNILLLHGAGQSVSYLTYISWVPCACRGRAQVFGIHPILT